MIGTGSKASQNIRPPGFINGNDANHARGHLLANILGGSGKDNKNLVTLYQQSVNSPIMRDFEREVKNAVKDGETVNYRVIPIYTGNNPMPTGISMSAAGSNGFKLDVSIPNVNEKK